METSIAVPEHLQLNILAGAVLLFVLQTVALKRIFPYQNIASMITISAFITYKSCWNFINGKDFTLTAVNLPQYLFGILPIQFFILAIVSEKKRLLLLIWMNMVLGLLSLVPPFSLHLSIKTYPMLMIYLASIPCIGLLLIWIADRSLNQLHVEISWRRKLFHFFPVIVLVAMNYATPQLDLNPQMLNIQKDRLISIFMAGAFYLMFMLELIRVFLAHDKLMKGYLKIQSQSQKKQKNINENSRDINKFLQIFFDFLFGNLYAWMAKFNDGRQQFMWLTHFYLYFGLILGHDFKDPFLINIACVLLIADAMAAIFGKKYGRKKVQITISNLQIKTNKTFIGALAYAITTYLLSFVFNSFHSDNIFEMDNKSHLFVIIISVLCSIAQLFSAQFDNIVPVVVYICCEKIF